MNDLQIYSYGDKPVRTVQKDGETWWVLKDVCEVLCMDSTQLKKVSDRLDNDEKGRTQITTPGGIQETWIINESGLYNVILRSDKPEAKNFKRWVTHEILPAIRKTGGYASPYIELSPQLQLLISIETKQKEQDRAIASTNARIDSIGEIIALNPNEWRDTARRIIVQIAHKLGGNEYIREVNAEVFQLMDERAGISLATRLTNKQQRMALEGVCKSKRDKLTKVDIIADDKKAIEIYCAIVKEMAIKYGIEQPKEALSFS